MRWHTEGQSNYLVNKPGMSLLQTPLSASHRLRLTCSMRLQNATLFAPVEKESHVFGERLQKTNRFAQNTASVPQTRGASLTRCELGPTWKHFRALDPACCKSLKQNTVRLTHHWLWRSSNATANCARSKPETSPTNPGHRFLASVEAALGKPHAKSESTSARAPETCPAYTTQEERRMSNSRTSLAKLAKLKDSQNLTNSKNPTDSTCRTQGTLASTLHWRAQRTRRIPRTTMSLHHSSESQTSKNATQDAGLQS